MKRRVATALLLSTFFCIPLIASAQSDEITGGNAQCFEGSQYVYVAGGAQVINGKQNLYGKDCDAFADGGELKAADGQCVAPKKCEAKLCAGKPCMKPDTAVDTSKQPLSSDPVVLKPADDTKQFADQKPVLWDAFNPTPTADQKTTLGDTSGVKGLEAIKEASMADEGGFIEAAKDTWGDVKTYFGAAPSAEDAVQLSGGTTGESKAVQTTDESGFTAESTFGGGGGTVGTGDADCGAWCKAKGYASSAVDSAKSAAKYVYDSVMPSAEAKPSSVEGAVVEGRATFDVTGYYPCVSASVCPVQGGPQSAVRGPDGKSLVRTLDDYRLGKSEYVTGASDKSRYGESYVIPEVTYKSAVDGKEYTLENVPVAIHDTGSAFRDRPDKLDIAMGVARSESEAMRLARNQPLLEERHQTYAQATDGGAGAGSGRTETELLPVAQNPRIAESAYGPLVESVQDVNYAGLGGVTPIERGPDLADITPRYVDSIPKAEWQPDLYSEESGRALTASVLAEAEADEHRQLMADQERAYQDRLAQADADERAFYNAAIPQPDTSLASGEEITKDVLDQSMRDAERNIPLPDTAYDVRLPTQKEAWAELLKTEGASYWTDTERAAIDQADLMERNAIIEAQYAEERQLQIDQDRAYQDRLAEADRDTARYEVARNELARGLSGADLGSLDADSFYDAAGLPEAPINVDGGDAVSGESSGTKEIDPAIDTKIRAAFDTQIKSANAQVTYAQELLERSETPTARAVAQTLLDDSNKRLDAVIDRSISYSVGNPTPELQTVISRMESGDSEGVLSRAFTNFSKSANAGAEEIGGSIKTSGYESVGEAARSVWDAAAWGAAKTTAGITDSARNAMEAVGVPGFRAETDRALADAIDPYQKEIRQVNDIANIAPFGGLALKGVTRGLGAGGSIGESTFARGAADVVGSVNRVDDVVPTMERGRIELDFVRTGDDQFGLADASAPRTLPAPLAPTEAVDNVILFRQPSNMQVYESTGDVAARSSIISEIGRTGTNDLVALPVISRGSTEFITTRTSDGTEITQLAPDATPPAPAETQVLIRPESNVIELPTVARNDVVTLPERPTPVSMPDAYITESGRIRITIRPNETAPMDGTGSVSGSQRSAVEVPATRPLVENPTIPAQIIPEQPVVPRVVAEAPRTPVPDPGDWARTPARGADYTPPTISITEQWARIDEMIAAQRLAQVVDDVPVLVSPSRFEPTFNSPVAISQPIAPVVQNPAPAITGAVRPGTPVQIPTSNIVPDTTSGLTPSPTAVTVAPEARIAEIGANSAPTIPTVNPVAQIYQPRTVVERLQDTFATVRDIFARDVPDAPVTVEATNPVAQIDSIAANGQGIRTARTDTYVSEQTVGRTTTEVVVPSDRIVEVNIRSAADAPVNADLVTVRLNDAAGTLRLRGAGDELVTDASGHLTSVQVRRTDLPSIQRGDYSGVEIYAPPEPTLARTVDITQPFAPTFRNVEADQLDLFAVNRVDMTRAGEQLELPLGLRAPAAPQTIRTVNTERIDPVDMYPLAETRDTVRTAGQVARNAETSEAYAGIPGTNYEWIPDGAGGGVLRERAAPASGQTPTAGQVAADESTATAGKSWPASIGSWMWNHKKTTIVVGGLGIYGLSQIEPTAIFTNGRVMVPGAASTPTPAPTPTATPAPIASAEKAPVIADAVEYPSNDPLRPEVAKAAESALREQARQVAAQQPPVVETPGETYFCVKALYPLNIVTVPIGAPMDGCYNNSGAARGAPPSALGSIVGSLAGKLFGSHAAGTGSQPTQPIKAAVVQQPTVQPAKPVVTMVANPATVSPGRPSTLSWSATGPTTCTIFDDAGKKIGEGAPNPDPEKPLTVSPSKSTVYKVTCTGGTGTANAEVTVAVFNQ